SRRRLDVPRQRVAGLGRRLDEQKGPAEAENRRRGLYAQGRQGCQQYRSIRDETDGGQPVGCKWTAHHAPSDGRQSARCVSDGLDQGWSVGDVEGNAVRPHHGPDDVDGEIRVQGLRPKEACRQKIPPVRKDAGSRPCFAAAITSALPGGSTSAADTSPGACY